LFRSKLGFRVVITIILSFLLLEAAVGAFVLSRQRQDVLDKRLESLRFSVGLLETEITRAVRFNRSRELSKVLSDLTSSYSAVFYTLFDLQGKPIVEEQVEEGFPGRTADLRVRLPLVEGDKLPASQVIEGPKGPLLRYVIPLHNEDGDLTGGLEMESPLSAVEPAIQKTTRQTLEIFLLAALGVVFLVVLIILPVFTHFVVKPINTVRGELESLSKGEADLTFQIQVKTRDEIGEMGQWFNSFLGRIRAMVTRVMEHSSQLTQQVETLSHSTAEVSAMSGDVTTTVQQIAKGAEEQAVKIAEVNQLMQEVQETMRDVERKAVETTKAVDKATQTARVGGKLARGTIEKMVDLSEVILKNSEMVGKLGTKSQEVGRVVELISGIAEQTNLLSLNAAIEAARAGEQGRGFAVVAEEIRALADGSSKAVQEITSLVSEMQDETSGVVVSMEKSSREAQVGKESIREMESALGEIVAVVESVVVHTRNITETISAQTLRFTKILHSIQDINAVSEQSAASTQEVSASTEEQSASMEQVSATCRELAAMAVELKQMVEKFKVK
jgi:methyl-accepting chemotaxis protein